MSLESLPVSRLVVLALAESFLTAEQAMQTCISYGKSIDEAKPFEVERFWLRNRWMNPVQIERLLVLHSEWSLFRVPRTMVEDTAVVISIQQLLRQQQQTPHTPSRWSTTKAAKGAASEVVRLDTTDDFSFEEESTYPTDEEETESDEDKHSNTDEMDQVDLTHSLQGEGQSFGVEDTEVFPMPSFSPDRSASSRDPRDVGSEVTMGSPPSWDEAPKSPSDPEWSVFEDFSSRYQVQQSSEELGQVGVAHVFDRNLERSLVRKSVGPGDKNAVRSAGRFVLGTRLLGQLEHSTIPQVYDLLLHERSLYATMPALPEATFAQKLHIESLTLLQQIRVLRRVCEGLAYAHDRGLVHRRVCPEHILLDDYGEVVLTGWDLADPNTTNAFDLRGVLARDKETLEQLQGDPRYMAPEWLSNGLITPAIDQYALGVMLYQCLTGTFPYEGEDTFALLYQISSHAPRSPHLRAPGRHLPGPLVALCMRMLAHNPAERFGTMQEVLWTLDAYEEEVLSGAKREQTANALYAEARLLAEQCEELSTYAAELRKRWTEAAFRCAAWASAEEKEALWQQEDAVEQARKEATTLFGVATQKYLRALENAPQHGQSRKGLATLLWRQYLKAEREGNLRTQQYFRDMLSTYDDGTYTAQAESMMQVSLVVPPGATFSIERLVPRLRRLQGTSAVVGDSILSHVELTPGSYRMVCDSEGAQVVVPFVVKRGEALAVEARFFAPVGDDFRLVQGGLVSCGGDLDAPGRQAETQQPIDDFWIAEAPVTFREYLAFLNDVHERDPKRARTIVPRVDGFEAFVKLNVEGKYVPNRKTLLAGSLATRYPAQDDLAWSLPVFGVSWFDAILYCRWRSEASSQKVTLPTEQEWERAAAGADQRAYPWGSHFDPSFCKMGRSRAAEERAPEPVRTFAFDESPFGVGDMAGGVREWTLHLSPTEVDALYDPPVGEGVLRGGCWADFDPNALRIGARTHVSCATRSRKVGFRVVIHLPPTTH